MNQPIDKTTHNREAWNKLAISKRKWFHDCTEQEIALAKSGELMIKLTPTKNLPAEWLNNLNGQRVLCLAGGGGQQAPLFAAAGATVTVFDISPAQLDRDLAVAERSGLTLDTIVGDMTDLSAFSDESFDLIINPTSVCYCSEIFRIWRECFRALRPGGELIVGAMNPINFLFDARERDRGQLLVRHQIPYSDLQLDAEERESLLGAENPLHYGHSLADLIGGQIEAGFRISGFFEDRWGDQDILSDLIAVFFCTKATKPGAGWALPTE